MATFYLPVTKTQLLVRLSEPSPCVCVATFITNLSKWEGCTLVDFSVQFIALFPSKKNIFGTINVHNIIMQNKFISYFLFAQNMDTIWFPKDKMKLSPLRVNDNEGRTVRKLSLKLFQIWNIYLNNIPITAQVGQWAVCDVPRTVCRPSGACPSRAPVRDGRNGS